MPSLFNLIQFQLGIHFQSIGIRLIREKEKVKKKTNQVSPVIKDYPSKELYQQRIENDNYFHDNVTDNDDNHNKSHK